MATHIQPAPNYKSSRRFEPTPPPTQKQRIPVVETIVTDEALGLLSGEPLAPVMLSKVEKLLTDPHSAYLHERHLSALKKVTKHYKHGFLLRDLVEVCKILNACADRLPEQGLYAAPLCTLLQISALPFLREKASDELSYEQIAVESVSQLGYLMRCPRPDVQMQICDTVSSIYTEEATGSPMRAMIHSTKHFRQRAVELSDASETLMKSLALIENNTEVKIKVLQVLQTLSKSSEEACRQMLRANAASRVCHQMNDVDDSGQVLFRSVEILWNLFDNCTTAEVADQLSSIDCINELRNAFIGKLTTGYSHYDRQLRNDILVIASHLAYQNPAGPFLETGFIKQLTLFATFQEVKSHHALVRHLKLMTNHEDFELKKLLMSMLVSLAREPATISVMSEGRLLLALFSYVRSNESTPSPREWTPAQFEELQLHALSCLASLAPLLMDDYLSCQGSTRLLLLLEWCVSSDTKDVYSGQGNSFYGAGGRGNKKAQMRFCIRLIRSVVSTQNEPALEDLVDQGAINQISSILVSAVRSAEVDDAIDIEMQSDMLTILSALCENNEHRKELFGSEGIEVVTHYLRTDPAKFTSGLGHHKLMLATVDCVWCAVIGCYTTEDLFFEKEGMFLLLDLLESCPVSMRNMVTGCLLDLSENEKAVPHIRTWRGKGNTTAPHLFCDIWRQEEQDMGVMRGEKGVISDPAHALAGTLQCEQQTLSLPANYPSTSIVDVCENVRAKIYALFVKIGYNALDGMSTEDYVTLTIIEQYLNLKTGEVWLEIVNELEEEGVRPVTPDREALETVGRAVAEESGGILMVQNNLLRAQQTQDLLEEKEFYAEVRDNHRQKEKAIESWREYISRTSNYQFLSAMKAKQINSVEASKMMVQTRPNDVLHPLGQSTMKTTVFSERTVQMESTPLDLTGGKLATYDPKLGTTRPRQTTKDVDKE